MNLSHELFRKAKITQPHFAEKEKHLKEQHSDRNLPEYDCEEHNVQSVELELDVLRLTFPENAASPRHPDNNENRVDHDDDPEASNEDGFGIYSFPFALFFGFVNIEPQGGGVGPLTLPLFLIASCQPGTGEVLVLLSLRI